MFLWQHLQCDVEVLAGLLDRNTDDAALIVHMILSKMTAYAANRKLHGYHCNHPILLTLCNVNEKRELLCQSSATTAHQARGLCCCPRGPRYALFGMFGMTHHQLRFILFSFFIFILEPAPAATNLKQKEDRMQWETAFKAAFVTPVLKVS